jgi:hypothetical protein
VLRKKAPPGQMPNVASCPTPTYVAADKAGWVTRSTETRVHTSPSSASLVVRHETTRYAITDKNYQ